MGCDVLSAGSANVLGVVADVFLLSRCKGLVGTHTSAVSKAAYLLMYHLLQIDIEIVFAKTSK